MGLEDLRREYRYGHLSRATLKPNPFDQFRHWLSEAIDSNLITDPSAMCLATVDARGRPWQRIVLLKQTDANSLVFFTHLDSRKAQAIATNPEVSLYFPWNAMDRQVIAGGVAVALDKTEAASYFASRPRGSQLATWASRQSAVLDSRQTLEAQFALQRDKYADRAIPMPDFWGGYRVVPDEFEFWQGGERRLHDRFRYLRDGASGWAITRLAP